MYDLFEDTFGLMITVKNESIRKQCKEIVLNFIQSFPLSDKLLEKIMLKLVNNLDFADHDGRLAVLSIMDKLFDKVPLEAFKEQLEAIWFGFTTRLVNEEVNVVRTSLINVFKLLLEKINSEDEHRGLINKMFDNCSIWIKSDNESTKRAGLQLIKLMFWVTGQYSRIENTVELMLADLEEVCNNIVEFWDTLKSDEDLRETLRDNMWRDVFWDEGDMDSSNALAKIKSTKHLVIDYLSFIEVIMCYDRTKTTLRSQLYGLVLRLSRHPDEDVQVEVLRVSSKVLQNEAYRNLGKEHLKSLLICLFASIKSRHLTEDVLPYINDHFKIIIGDYLNDIPKILSTIVTAITSITFKHLRLGTKGVTVSNKCLSVSRVILYSLTGILDDSDLESLIGYFLRLLEHGAIKDSKQTTEQLEQDLIHLEGLASSPDKFMSLMTSMRHSINYNKQKTNFERKEIARNPIVDDNTDLLAQKSKQRTINRIKRKQKEMDKRMGVHEKKLKLV